MDEPPSYTLSNIFVEQGLLYFILIAIFLFITAVASASEAAFFSLNANDIEAFRNSRGRREHFVTDLLTNPRLLTTVLATWKYLMLALTSVLSLIPFIHTEIVASTETIATDVIILVMIFSIFGVIVPKIYGSTYPKIVSIRTAYFSSLLMQMSKKVVKPLLKMSFKVEQKLEEISEQASVEELTQALELAAADTETTDDDKEILKGIVNFGMLTVKQVMRPRVEISYADIAMDFHQLLQHVQKSGYSRIPVCQGSLDKVEGILYIKDLLPFLEEPETYNWRSLLRSGYFIPESKKIDFLLKDFQEKRVHIAIVVDEFGGTSGLITLEDVIEEIIGDIHDEFDEIGSNFQKINETTYLFDGKTSILQFSKILKISPTVFDDLKGETESIGGLLVKVFGEIPEGGTEINIGPLSFIAESVDHKKIRKIRVHIHEHEAH